MLIEKCIEDFKDKTSEVEKRAAAYHIANLAPALVGQHKAVVSEHEELKARHADMTERHENTLKHNERLKRRLRTLEDMTGVND